jgi:hypothetical protein
MMGEYCGLLSRRLYGVRWEAFGSAATLVAKGAAKRILSHRGAAIGYHYGNKKKAAAVAAVHWPESTDIPRMGLGDDTRGSNGEGQIETAGRGAGISQGSRADLGHVGIHRIPISQVLLISPAGDAEAPAIALSGSQARGVW